MNTLFTVKDIKLDDIFLNIKYEGPSFKGVMNIQDLGNELIGLEYCIKSILKQLRDIGKNGVLFLLIISLCKVLKRDYLLSLLVMSKKRLVHAVQ